jgi:hypothetical protein
MSKKYILTFSFFLSIGFSFSQADTSQIRGTIKIAKQNDSTYIKVVTDFVMFSKAYDNNATFVSPKWMENNTPISSSERVKIVEPCPVEGADSFNYSDFFRKNNFTKNIRMREGESDTVNLAVLIDNHGNVKFNDYSPVEKLGDVDVVYTNYKKTKYKVDVSHQKTYNAFAQLAQKKWVPAKVLRLKKHPSKHKVKYTSVSAYTQGVITVIYSSIPFND